MTPALQTVLDAIPAMDAAALPGLLGDLRHVEAAALARLLAPPAVPQPLGDTLLNVEDAARRMGMSTDFMYHNKDKFPFTRKVGTRLLFSANGIEAYIRKKA